MALSPKLNVYVIALNPKDKEAGITYRDFFSKKYSMASNKSLKDCYNNFFRDFLQSLGTTKFRKDKESKKVIGCLIIMPKMVQVLFL